MGKTVRINTNINEDKVLNVNMRQDMELMEVLSLKLSSEDAYNLHSSNYGVVVGRVLANDAFGIPNAKVSLFISRDTSDITEIAQIYPFSSVSDTNGDGIRYNLLPDSSNDDCYRIVGTFPNKRLLLDNDIQLEIFDKYWKFTTTTNKAGDYMIFGVPKGNQQVHVDIDLSDIGILSQKPRDLEYKGYNITQFDNAVQFKQSSNLNNLVQIISQDKSVFVYPFWGDNTNDVIAISRCDVSVDYKFEPTCVFMGSIISDNGNNSLGHKCEPSRFMGYNDQLVGGEGRIEMIRKTPGGLVEEKQIQGNQLIDENGVFCYQIPMNLDYVGTDEMGNIVATNDISKGIPTRTRVRFRISKTDTDSEGVSRHTAKYLVPNNPVLDEDSVTPALSEDDKDLDKFYEFGSSTPDDCFRDMYWNKIYSVKNYIPRLQIAHRSVTKNYTGIRMTNVVDNQNPAPFSTVRIDIPFTYMMICVIMTIVIGVIKIINTCVYLIDEIIDAINKLARLIIKVATFGIARPHFNTLSYMGCISLGSFGESDNVAYYPGCHCPGSDSCNNSSCPDNMPNCRKSSDSSTLSDIMQQGLAEEYHVVKTDFYDDWLNGTLYFPLWRWRKRKKKSFFFGLFHAKAKSEYCSCSTKFYSRLKLLFACSLTYNIDNNLNKEIEDDTLKPNDSTSTGKQYKANTWKRPSTGVITNFVNDKDEDVYYYSPGVLANGSDVDFLRYFATDLILLGSLNENDANGVPQMFKNLPSTTSNVPAIATIVESDDTEDENEENTTDGVSNNNDAANDAGNESGTTVVTGMDWGHGGGSDKEMAYKDGLFVDLACTEVTTLIKTCINSERMSELGVNLDMTYASQFGPNDSQIGTFLTDGMITKMELDDYETRAMFATLNHNGFVPVSDNYVYDKNTGYMLPKFEYLYPVDFDGRLKSSIDKYWHSNRFLQGEGDKADKAYLTFRYGTDKPARFHYYYRNAKKRAFPLYNNSFYFYFGIKPGSTAIDKLNSLFYSDCATSEKYPFTMDITTKPVASCPFLDVSGDGENDCNSQELDEAKSGYIIIKLKNILKPYSYELFDYYGKSLYLSEESEDDYIAIGAEVDNEGTVISQSGKYDGVHVLSNTQYKLKIIDNNGNIVNKAVTLKSTNINCNTTIEGLGGQYKFSDDAESSREYITGNSFDGSVTINDFYIDGNPYAIQSISSYTDLTEDSSWQDKYINTLKTASLNDIMGWKLALSGSVSGDTEYIYMTIEPSASGMTIADVSTFDNPYCSFSDNKVIFKLFYPDRYNLRYVQICDCAGEYAEGEQSTISLNYDNLMLNVVNGQNFDLALNGVNLELVMGQHEIDGQSGYTSSCFYDRANNISVGRENSFNISNLENTRYSGWFNAYKEDCYKFPTTESLWEEYVDLYESEAVNSFLKKKFKLQTMFDWMNSIYFTDSSEQSIRVDSVGGKNPVLTRSFRPMYEEYDGDSLTMFAFGNNDTLTYASDLPNIVANNYKAITGSSSGTAYFNPSVGSTDAARRKQGMYVGGYTSNAGIVTLNRKCYASAQKYQSVPVRSNPYNVAASNSPLICPYGEDEIVTNFMVNSSPYPDVYNYNGTSVPAYNPYFRLLTVDRRLDYSLTIFPSRSSQSTGMPISGSTDWQLGSIVGTIYNGIPMAYTTSGSITEGNIIGEGLEYSLSGNSVVFNDSQSTKRYLNSVIINDEDLTYSPEFTYEGDEGLISKNYPLEKTFYRRRLDSNNFNMTVVNNSYNINVTEEYTPSEEVSGLTAYVSPGESISFKLKLDNLITPCYDEGKDYLYFYVKGEGNAQVASTYLSSQIGYYYNDVTTKNDTYGIIPSLPFILFRYYFDDANKDGRGWLNNLKSEGGTMIVDDGKTLYNYFLDEWYSLDTSGNGKKNKRNMCSMRRHDESVDMTFDATNRVFTLNGETLTISDSTLRSVEFCYGDDNGIDSVTDFNVYSIVTPVFLQDESSGNLTRGGLVFAMTDPLDDRPLYLSGTTGPAVVEGISGTSIDYDFWSVENIAFGDGDSISFSLKYTIDDVDSFAVMEKTNFTIEELTAVGGLYGYHLTAFITTGTPSRIYATTINGFNYNFTL